MATFTNQATLTYNGLTVSSNTVSGQMISPLSLTKTAGEDVYAPGDTVSYVISLVNDGSVTYDGLTLTDDLGGYAIGAGTAYPLSYVQGSVRYFINGVLQSAPAVTPGGPMAISGLSVPAGGNAMLVYETQVTSAAPDTAAETKATLTLTGVTFAVQSCTTTFLQTTNGSYSAGSKRGNIRPDRRGAVHRQEPLPRHGCGERAAHLHLLDPELRQRGGRRCGGHCGFRPL